MSTFLWLTSYYYVHVLCSVDFWLIALADACTEQAMHTVVTGTIIVGICKIVSQNYSHVYCYIIPGNSNCILRLINCYAILTCNLILGISSSSSISKLARVIIAILFYIFLF